jgi:serine/threonine protein phosphatase PrpC
MRFLSPFSYNFLFLHLLSLEGLFTEAVDILQLLDGQDTSASMGLLTADVQDSLDRIVTKCLKDTFLKTDNDFISSCEDPQHGSTATTALIMGSRLYSANVGDSRTLLCRNFEPFPLSEDHKPAREDENKRIRDAGGFVINNRVMGELAVSRAFGDCEFKKGIQVISALTRFQSSRAPCCLPLCPPSFLGLLINSLLFIAGHYRAGGGPNIKGI